MTHNFILSIFAVTIVVMVVENQKVSRDEYLKVYHSI